MIIGIGTDIVKTARFKGMTEHFMARVFTPAERAYLLKKGHITAAGIFAAKEAVAKALGTGFSGFWPNQIEISHNDLGKPSVILHDTVMCIAMELANDNSASDSDKYSINLSISHTDTDALAFVIISKLDI